MCNHSLSKQIAIYLFVAIVCLCTPYMVGMENTKSSSYEQDNGSTQENEQSLESIDYDNMEIDSIGGYKLLIGTTRICKNTVEHEFKVLDKEDSEIAIACYSVYHGPLKSEKKETIINQLIFPYFNTALLPRHIRRAETLVCLSYIFVEKQYRKELLGATLFKRCENYFKDKYHDAVMVWLALPIGENPLSFAKLCNFYNKNGGTRFYVDYIIDRAYYYKKLNNDKKRTYSELVVEETCSTNKKRRRIFKTSCEMSTHYSNKNIKDVQTKDIISLYHTMPDQFALF